MIRRALHAIAALLTVAAVAGCSPRYDALTTPPPFAKAELCDGADTCGGGETIDLTQGVALAFECVSSQGGACTNAKLKVSDPAIASVFDGYLDTLSASSGYARTGAAPRTAFVIVGMSVGKATLTVTSDAGKTDFAVTVQGL